MKRIMLATLCLNEKQWLPRLVEQHRDWPGVTDWVFVEAADRAYSRINPHMVTRSGLSVDGTTQFLEHLELTGARFRVHYKPVGFVDGPSKSQGKVTARNIYMRVADDVEPDWIVILDADEFYTRDHQRVMTELLATLSDEPRKPVLFRQRNIWQSPRMQDAGLPLCQYEVVGGYWSVPHLRVWPWYPGSRYRDNHNNICLPDGTDLRNRMIRFDGPRAHAPQCIHTAFASSYTMRKAKHVYYQARGEGPDDGRQRYVECRAAWETWTPGTELPQGAQVITYNGPRPEVLCA